MIGVLVLGSVLAGVLRKVNCVEAMTAGAKTALKTAVGILPPLV